MSFTLSSSAQEKKDNDGGKWVTIKGQVIFDGADVPTQKPINLAPGGQAHPDKAGCAKDPDLKSEEWIVNPKNKGIRDVYVWVEPLGTKRGTPFPAAQINPALATPKATAWSIDQPCCRFIPRVLAVRVGDSLAVKSSPTIAHNANFQSENNGSKNIVIPADAPPVTMVEKFVAEPGPIGVACNIHPWMKSTIRVFDHPYFALTDEKGKFEIKLAPIGKFRLFVWHAQNGWKDGVKGAKGELMEIKGNENGVVDMKEIKVTKN